MSAHAATAPSETDATGSVIMRLLAAGAAGLLVWEVFARLVAPLWIGEALIPAGLVEAALGIGQPAAELVHIATGLIAYPVGFAILAALLPRVPPLLLGVGYGVGLTVFALYGMAHLLAGFPPFLGFGEMAQASLVGHVLFGSALGLVLGRSHSA
jgi:hypothetical protein